MGFELVCCDKLLEAVIDLFDFFGVLLVCHFVVGLFDVPRNILTDDVHFNWSIQHFELLLVAELVFADHADLVKCIGS